jgi:hypothetical protein
VAAVCVLFFSSGVADDHAKKYQIALFCRVSVMCIQDFKNPNGVYKCIIRQVLKLNKQNFQTSILLPTVMSVRGELSKRDQQVAVVFKKVVKYSSIINKAQECDLFHYPVCIFFPLAFAALSSCHLILAWAMEKVYESISCGKVAKKDLNSLLDLLKFYSAPHLQTTAYLKYETEFANIQNRTSIFLMTLHTIELTALTVSILEDTEKVYINALKDTPPVKSIIDGTKFKPGEHMVRVINASTVQGDVHSLLTQLGCR